MCSKVVDLASEIGQSAGDAETMHGVEAALAMRDAERCLRRALEAVKRAEGVDVR